MNEIKHDDEWLEDNAPSLASWRPRGVEPEPDRDAIDLAMQYLEHMTRVRVTADELPEIGVFVLLYGDPKLGRKAKLGGIVSILRKNRWMVDGNPYPLSFFPEWQPILRSGGWGVSDLIEQALNDVTGRWCLRSDVHPRRWDLADDFALDVVNELCRMRTENPLNDDLVVGYENRDGKWRCTGLYSYLYAAGMWLSFDQGHLQECETPDGWTPLLVPQEVEND